MEERTGLVTLYGDSLTLVGSGVKVGDPALYLEVLDNDLNPVTISSFRGTVCVIS